MLCFSGAALHFSVVIDLKSGQNCCLDCVCPSFSTSGSMLAAAMWPGDLHPCGSRLWFPVCGLI